MAEWLEHKTPRLSTRVRASLHLDLSRCPLLHKSLQPVLRTVRVVIQPESSGCRASSSTNSYKGDKPCGASYGNGSNMARISLFFRSSLSTPHMKSSMNRG